MLIKNIIFAYEVCADVIKYFLGLNLLFTAWIFTFMKNILTKVANNCMCSLIIILPSLLEKNC